MTFWRKFECFADFRGKLPIEFQQKTLDEFLKFWKSWRIFWVKSGEAFERIFRNFETCGKIPLKKKTHNRSSGRIPGVKLEQIPKGTSWRVYGDFLRNFRKKMLEEFPKELLEEITKVSNFYKSAERNFEKNLRRNIWKTSQSKFRKNFRCNFLMNF